MKFLKLNYQMVGQIAKMIEFYPDQSELMLNNLRILSKISLSEECCKIMMENKDCMKNIISFFKTYRANTYIIIRVAFILALYFLNSVIFQVSFPILETIFTFS